MRSTIFWTEDKIKQLKDVRFFFDYLVDFHKLSFNPDTDFNDYVDVSEMRIFGSKTAERLNAVMAQCRVVCKNAKADIYQIAVTSIN